MRKSPVQPVFCAILLLCAACMIQPVMAESGTITIAYRGAGGGYIGENIVFDGRDTFGNTTLIRISGPGLPAGGVSPTNLNGEPGSSTPVNVDRDGTWKFVWYADITPGTERLQTAKYTFTATDAMHPNESAETSFMLKRREYSITATPVSVTTGGYISFTGFTEEEVNSVDIGIVNSTGSTVFSVPSTVSSSGYFSYGFHADLPPGVYRVVVSNPAFPQSFATGFTITQKTDTNLTSVPETPTQAPVTPAGEQTTGPAPAPTSSPAEPGVILAGLAAGAVLRAVYRRK